MRLPIFDNCDIELLKKKATHLKTTDAEGWAIGETILMLLYSPPKTIFICDSCKKDFMDCQCFDKQQMAWEKDCE
jgi:hypothetical protein